MISHATELHAAIALATDMIITEQRIVDGLKSTSVISYDGARQDLLTPVKLLGFRVLCLIVLLPMAPGTAVSAVITQHAF